MVVGFIVYRVELGLDKVVLFTWRDLQRHSQPHGSATPAVGLDAVLLVFFCNIHIPRLFILT